MNIQNEITFLKDIEGLRKIMLGRQSWETYELIKLNHRVIVKIEQKGKDFYMTRWWMSAKGRGWSSSKKGVLLTKHVPPKTGAYTLHKKQYEAILEAEKQAKK